MRNDLHRTLIGGQSATHLKILVQWSAISENGNVLRLAVLETLTARIRGARLVMRPGSISITINYLQVSPILRKRQNLLAPIPSSKSRLS